MKVESIGGVSRSSLFVAIVRRTAVFSNAKNKDAKFTPKTKVWQVQGIGFDSYIRPEADIKISL
ncbi:hypothetical protein [Pollutibacter soli]|uniref:hypothetical protein n=1 Tax=Pollutibacter soli TaxID=3034157 RepID=UPI003013D328